MTRPGHEPMRQRAGMPRSLGAQGALVGRSRGLDVTTPDASGGPQPPGCAGGKPNPQRPVLTRISRAGTTVVLEQHAAFAVSPGEVSGISSTDDGRTGGQTTTTDTRSQRTRASRRGDQRTTTGSQPIVQTGLPHCVPPRKPPCPGSPLTTRPEPDFLSKIFMPRSQPSHAFRASGCDRPHVSAAPR